MEKILVAYASKYGSTKEIAEKIAKKLSESGLETDIDSVKNVKSLNDYKAIVLGSAAYMGQWRKEAVKFINANTNELSEKPVWIFTTGPTGKGDPLELLNGWKYPKKITETIESIKPEDTAVFHGKLDSASISGFERWILKKVKAPVGDFRDWDMIDRWTDTLIEKLK